jgi:hypothetical protein
MQSAIGSVDFIGKAQKNKKKSTLLRFTKKKKKKKKKNFKLSF